MSEPPRVGVGQFNLEGSYDILPVEPVKVGTQRQLLVDQHIISDWWNCRRTVHQPEKHPANPLIEPQKPCEGSGPQGGTVLYDEERGCFRYWGCTSDETRVSKERGKDEFFLRTVYYESTDGVHWTSPNLGIVEFDGSRDNNLVLGGDGSLHGAVSVVRLPEGRLERGRYAMMSSRARAGRWRWDVGEPHTMAQYIAFSDDGLHWTDQAENPVFRGRSDTQNNIIYHPGRDVFLHYRRATVNGHECRRMAFSESKDLISWTQPQNILLPDELDPPMHYGMPVSVYQGLCLGFLQNFYFDEEQELEKELKIDIQLAWSRDGRIWERHPERPVFLPTGRTGTYDWGMVLLSQGIVERGDRLYLYYTGHERIHPIVSELIKGAYPGALSSPREGWETWTAGVRRIGSEPHHFCLATLRRDGFVSVDASGEGYLLTVPLECPGGRLHINARTGKNGFVRVALRRGDGVRDGEWLEDWSYDEGTIFVGDSVDHRVDWRERDSLDRLKGTSIRLHFWMQEAELYSFWFEPLSLPSRDR